MLPAFKKLAFIWKRWTFLTLIQRSTPIKVTALYMYTFRGVSHLSDVGSAGVKPLYLIKTYRAGYQTIPRNLKQNKLWDFLRPLNATVLEPPFESSSRREYILFNLSLSFRTQSAKNTCLRFAILSYSEKLWNVFEIVL